MPDSLTVTFGGREVVLNLTLYQKKVIAALAAFGGNPEWLTRREIGSIIPRNSQGRWECGSAGVPLRTMESIGADGLVVPEAKITLQHVRDGVCTCGCDRWKLSDLGTKCAEGLNIKYTDATFARVGIVREHYDDSGYRKWSARR